MKKISLKAQERKNKDSSNRQLRKNGVLPAVIYGKKTESQSLKIDKIEFDKAFSQAGTSSLINLKVSSKKPVRVIIQEVQYDPVSDEIIHADFYQIRKDEKIKTEIPLEITGKSPAVEEEGGNLITDKDEIEVECLPDKLVEKIEVDISVLETFEDVIRIKDLNIPKGIEVLEEKEEVVATTTAPRSEEELEELEETPTASDVEEVEVEGEKEDEEGEDEIEEEEGEEQKEEKPSEEQEEEEE